MGSRYRHESINQDFVHVVSCPSLASLEKPEAGEIYPSYGHRVGAGRSVCPLAPTSTKMLHNAWVDLV